MMSVSAAAPRNEYIRRYAQGQDGSFHSVSNGFIALSKGLSKPSTVS
ncbi:MAG: hypothetical protein AAGA46_11370 [Cyanobacteria bacterium P01_F01_bin.13]